MDNNQILLQNLLARSSVLLYRASKALALGPQNATLVIECEQFFSEAKKSLSAAISTVSLKATPTPAPIVETNGQNWSSEKPVVSSKCPFPANTTGVAVSLNLSSGGNLEPLVKPLTPSKGLSWFMNV